MTYEQKYTELDGKWHAIGFGETTVCGIVIPHGNGYSLLPDGKKSHCGPAPETGETGVEEEPEEPPTPLAAPAKKPAAKKATKA